MLERDKQYLLNLITKYDAISFDVFDTVLFRDVSKPIDVFFKKSRIFALNRIIAEKSARFQGRLQGKADIAICDIYKLLPFYDVLDEIALEKKHISADKDMVEVIETCQDLRKKIYFVSDMYFSKSTINEFLIENGIKEPFELYVSSEYGLPKSKGLFNVLLKSDGVSDSSKLMHVGDNYLSDYAAAKKSGIDAYHLKSF